MSADDDDIQFLAVDSASEAMVITKRQAGFLFDPSSSVFQLIDAGGGVYHPTRQGSLRATITSGDETASIDIGDVQCLEGAPTGLLSVSRLEDMGCSVIFAPTSRKVIFPAHLTSSGNELSIEMVREGGLYKLPLRLAKSMARVASLTKRTPLEMLKMVHAKFGHPSAAQTKTIATGVYPKVDFSNVDLGKCSACSRAKMKLKIPRDRTTKILQPLELVCVDMDGPRSTPTLSMRGSPYRYAMMIRDHSTRYTAVFLLRDLQQSKVAAKMEEYFNGMYAALGSIPKRIRADNDCFKAEATQEMLRRRGVAYEPSNPYEQWQNGSAEKAIQDMNSYARAMSLGEYAPRGFDLWAVKMAAYRYSHMPNAKIGGRMPVVALLEYFGKSTKDVTLAAVDKAICAPFAPVTYNITRKHKGEKSSPRAHDAIVLGNSQVYPGKLGEHSHIVYDMETGRIESVGNVWPAEHTFATQMVSYPLVGRRVAKEFIRSGVKDTYSGTVLSYHLPYYRVLYDDGDMEEVGHDEANELVLGGASEKTLGVGSLVHASDEGMQFDDDILINRVMCGAVKQLLALTPGPGPKLKEALSGPHAARWEQSLEREFGSHDDLGSFEMVDVIPKGHRALNSQVVLVVKPCAFSMDNVICKARLVICGNQDSTDYPQSSVYAPVGGWSTFLALIAFAVERGLSLMQFDWKTAFVQAPMQPGHEVYIRFPAHTKYAGKFARLRRNLYGLRTAPRTWFDEVVKFLRGEFEVQQCDRDACLFRVVVSSGWVLLCLYVDDMLTVPSSDDVYEKFKAPFLARFEIDEMGEVKTFLKMSISRDLASRKAIVNAPAFVDSMIEKYGFSQCVPVPSPSSKLVSFEEESATVEVCEHRYRAMVGSLNWLASTVRPDIAAVVSMAAQRSKDPNSQDMREVSRIMKYVKGTRDFGICFDGSLNVLVHCDADGQEDEESRKPRIGYVLMLGSSPIYWKSTLGGPVTLSTAESELIAVVETLKMLLHQCDILRFIGMELPEPLTMHSDNQAAIFMALDSAAFKRTKHFDIRHKFTLQHCVGAGKAFDIKHVRSEANRADIFTKKMAAPLFVRLRDLLVGELSLS